MFLLLPFQLSWRHHSYEPGKPRQQRVSADLTNPARCKLSIIAEATAEMSLSLPVRRLLPHGEHFHPLVVRGTKVSKKVDSRRTEHWFVAANLLPLEQQVIGDAMLEKWDYCLRRLYVLKGQSLKMAVGYVLCFSTVGGGRCVDFGSFRRFLWKGRWLLELKLSLSHLQTRVFHQRSGSTSIRRSGIWISRIGLWSLGRSIIGLSHPR